MAKRKVFSIGNSLSDGLEQTIASAHNYSSNLRIDVIPLKKIQLDPDNPRIFSLTLEDIFNGLDDNDPEIKRKNLEIESLSSLTASIKEQGIINPVIVYEYNGMYRLIAGERRTLASALANKTDIQVKILDGKPSEVKIRILQWIENIERADLLLSEKIDNLEKIIEAYAKEKNITKHEVTITDISHLIGCVKSHAINIKAVLEADSDIKELISTNQIRSLEKAAIVSNIKSDVLRKTALNECINGATLKQLKVIAEKDKLNPVLKAPKSSVGRPSRAVSLGKTPNIKVAGIILKLLIESPGFSHYRLELSTADFDDPKTLSNTFKKLIEDLEKLHG